MVFHRLPTPTPSSEDLDAAAGRRKSRAVPPPRQHTYTEGNELMLDKHGLQSRAAFEGERVACNGCWLKITRGKATAAAAAAAAEDRRIGLYSV